MHSEPENGQTARVQFSLTTLLALVAVAAVMAASITELPEWVGAPLLALVATTAAAVVVGTALRSRGYALTFYVGVAFPLFVLVLRTALVLPALSEGILESRTIDDLNTLNYLEDRHSYRFEAATVMALAPLVGLVCLGFHLLGDKRAMSGTTQRTAQRRWGVPVFLCLLLAGTASWVGVRSLGFLFPFDAAWDVHDGSAVQPSGHWIKAPGEVASGDRVLVEQAGSWWRGRVKSVAADGSVTIHYVGWGSNWDESVPASRLQLP